MLQTYEHATARCWLEVDLTALNSNAERVIQLCGDQIAIPVLKGNAYGMGSVPVARELMRLGLNLFATSMPIEALEIKQALPDAQVLMLGICEAAFIEPSLKAGLIFTLASSEQAKLLSVEASRLGLHARVHIKINTGLNRIGFDDLRDLQRSLLLPGLCPEGIFTHLALHSEKSDRAQLNLLNEFADKLNLPLMRHALDSIGLSLYPAVHHDAVRIGAWLWGVKPMQYKGESCLPIQVFKARVVQIRDLPEGSLIGYDDDHPLQRPSRIATISVGYADGYPRFHNIGHVEIRDMQAPIVGLVGMDALMADITDISNIRVGDIVTLLGGSISLDQYAKWANTNRNDAISRISRRVPRVYIRDGKPESLATYFMPCEEVQP